MSIITTRAALAAPLGLLASALIAADDPHLHHHHGGTDAGALHFTHPLVADSPTPDDKIHLGYRFDAGEDLDVHMLHLHAEYVIAPALSLSVGLPYSQEDDGHERESGVGNLHLGIKTANMAFADHGIVLTAGFAVVAPTGDDDIGGHHGGDHWTIAPLLGGGWRDEDWELVLLASFAIPVDRGDGDDDHDTDMGMGMMAMDHEETHEPADSLGFNAALQRHLPGGWSAVVELAGDSVLAGDDAGDTAVEAILGAQVHPPTWPGIGLGAGVAIPLEDSQREVGVVATAMWHY